MNERELAIEAVVLETLRRGERSSIVVAGMSMEPWIRRGDRVWLEPVGVGARPLAVGDVVLVADDRIRQIHRVIAMDGGGLVVKGDACAGGAWEIAASLVAARATSIERRGRSIPMRPWLGRFVAACSPYARYYNRLLMLAIRLFRRETS